MSLPDVTKAFEEIMVEYGKEHTRMMKAIEVAFDRVKTQEEFNKIDSLGEVCFTHIISNIHDATFWVKRLADQLEKL